MKLLGKSRYTVLAVLGLVSLSACVGNSSNNQNNSIPTTTNSGVIIDPMSNVPVLNGTGTQGTLYIHNYTNQVVTGLSFSLNQPTFISKLKTLITKAGVNFSSGIEDKNGFTLLNSERCVEIAANSSCAINFMTPNLSIGNLGNALVNVNYELNGKSITNSQVVNYSYVNSNLSTGVNFTGNVDVSGTLGSAKYVVGYLYGANSNIGIYKNVNLVSNNPATVISGGFTNNQEVAPNQVIAVEYKIAIQSNQRSYVEVVPTWNSGTSDISRSNVNAGSGSILGISIDPKQNTANYVFGNVPILDAKTDNTVTIPVVNNGNANGTALTVVKSGGNIDGIDIDISDCTANKLQANANGSCNVIYTVKTYTPGSTTVSYKDTNNNTVGSQVIYWTNDKPFPAVAAYSNIKNVVIVKRSNSDTLKFDFTNIGNAPLESMVTTPIITGPVEWVQTENTCTSVMGVGDSCYIEGYIHPNDDGVGTIYFATTGGYDNQSYDFVSLPVRYMVTANPEVVIIPAQEINVTVLANNVSSTTNTYVAKNIGNDPALITGIDLSAMTNLHKPIIANGGTCNGITTLDENESCTLIVTYGPELSNIAINESGSTHIVIDYHGGTPDTIYQTVSESYNYRLVGNDTYARESIVISGFNSGIGTQASPYQATALSESTEIKVTYTNPSVNYPLTNFNLNTNNLPYGMKLVSTDCPTGDSTTTLAIGVSCEMKFSLDRELLKTSSQGGTTAILFTTPTATWTTPLGFYKQTGTNIFIRYVQPTVSFSLSLNNGNFESTVLTARLTNASSGVSPFVVNVSSVDGWLESSPIALSNNCTVSQDYAVSCSLANGVNESGNIKYTMPTYAEEGTLVTVPLFYSTPNLGYLGSKYSLINYAAIVPWLAVGSPGFSTSEVLYTSLAINESGTLYLAYMDGSSGRATVMRFNGESWVYVGVPRFSPDIWAYQINLALDESGTPYVAYSNGGNDYKASVMKFNGESWVSVGAPNFSGRQAGSVKIVIGESGVPYVAYSDGTNYSAANVVKFNGESWVNVGLPNFKYSASYLSLAVDESGVLYLGFRDGSKNSKATVMKFDGSAWVNVGNAGFSNGAILSNSLAIDKSGTPYIVYKDYSNGDKATSMKFNGTNWVSVGNVAGFSGGDAEYLSLAINESGIPYVGYRDGSKRGKATVMMFDGLTWSSVNSAGFSAGVADCTSLAINESGVPYIAYRDGGNDNKATVMQP